MVSKAAVRPRIIRIKPEGSDSRRTGGRYPSRMATPVILKNKIGVMEKWSIGVLGEALGTLSFFTITPILHHSITPVVFF